MVGLSSQTDTFSVSPLLLTGLMTVVGLAVFGGQLLLKSRTSYSIEEDLLDTLATEDLDPIVTEDYMDEIALS